MGYISGLTSNCQTQLSAITSDLSTNYAPLVSPTFPSGLTSTAGTTSLGITNCSALATCNAGLNVMTTGGAGTALRIYSTPSTSWTTISQVATAFTIQNGGTAEFKISGTSTFQGAITAGGLITANLGLTIPTSKILTLVGNISANSVTVTPTQLSYVSGLTSNAQTQLNAITANVSTNYAPLTAPTFPSGITSTAGTTSLGTTNCSGLLSCNAGCILPVSQILTLNGNISANLVTVTPVELSYVSGLTSNAQTQLTNITTNISTNYTTTAGMLALSYTTLSAVQANANTFNGATTLNSTVTINGANFLNFYDSFNNTFSSIKQTASNSLGSNPTMTINAAGTLALSTNFLTLSGTLVSAGNITCNGGISIPSGQIATAPTAVNGNNSTTIATTAFFQNSIKSGTFSATYSASAGTYTSFAVTFPTAFTGTPTAVIVTQKFQTTGAPPTPSGLHLTVQAISLTGFTLGVHNTSTTNWLGNGLNIYWIAI